MAKDAMHATVATFDACNVDANQKQRIPFLHILSANDEEFVIPPSKSVSSHLYDYLIPVSSPRYRCATLSRRHGARLRET